MKIHDNFRINASKMHFRNHVSPVVMQRVSRNVFNRDISLSDANSFFNRIRVDIKPLFTFTMRFIDSALERKCLSSSPLEEVIRFCEANVLALRTDDLLSEESAQERFIEEVEKHFPVLDGPGKLALSEKIMDSSLRAGISQPIEIGFAHENRNAVSVAVETLNVMSEFVDSAFMGYNLKEQMQYEQMRDGAIRTIKAALERKYVSPESLVRIISQHIDTRSRLIEERSMFEWRQDVFIASLITAVAPKMTDVPKGFFQHLFDAAESSHDTRGLFYNSQAIFELIKIVPSREKEINDRFVEMLSNLTIYLQAKDAEFTIPLEHFVSVITASDIMNILEISIRLAPKEEVRGVLDEWNSRLSNLYSLDDPGSTLH